MDSAAPHQARAIPDLPVLTVSQLTQAIKLSLEATFPLVCVQGEISNFKRHSSGHLYFSIKDANAQISVVMFRNEALRLRHQPKDGDKVVVRGELTVYPLRGNYQLVIREMSLAGLGELLMKLEELKATLQQRGWFDPEHKKAIPRFPRKIGVVTSPTGAVIQDILNVLSRRYSGFHLILNPVRVQGDGAAAEIAQAIEQFNHYDLVDVIIVARGGGSIEDLWAFNEERVASAIYHSRIPIISAVGHETDVTIADFVADKRAPTPSAAAEIVIAEREQQLQHLHQVRQRLILNISHLLKHYRQRLKDLMRQPMLASPTYLLGQWLQKLDDLKSAIDQSLETQLKYWRVHLNAIQRQLLSLSPSTQIKYFRQKLSYFDQTITTACRGQLAARRRQLDVSLLRGRLDKAWQRQHDLKKERLKQLWGALSSIDPKRLLGRGYSILFSEMDGSIINSVKVLKKDQNINIMVSDGHAKAIVTEIVQQ